MSDFKVIKCKKCNAGLVEMSGQKLTSCVQCGHVFGMKDKKIQNRPRTINGLSRQTLKQVTNTTNPPSQAQNKTDMQTILRKLKALKKSAQSTPVQTQAKTQSKTPKVLPKKNKGFPLGTIIFWIILFNVLRNIFKM